MPMTRPLAAAMHAASVCPMNLWSGFSDFASSANPVRNTTRTETASMG